MLGAGRRFKLHDTGVANLRRLGREICVEPTQIVLQIGWGPNVVCYDSDPTDQEDDVGASVATWGKQERLMFKIMSYSAGVLLAGATLANAQSTVQKLPVNSTPTIQGCVAQVQRDGSLAPKAGATATPQTVSQEANNPDPTGVYQLLDARLVGATGSKPTSYALSGHEAELAKLEGLRVEVSGTVVPPLGDNRPGHPAAGDGTQRIRVSAVKIIEGQCSAAKK